MYIKKAFNYFYFLILIIIKNYKLYNNYYNIIKQFNYKYKLIKIFNKKLKINLFKKI